MTLREPAKLFSEREISGAPVVDGHGGLLGMISQTDIGVVRTMARDLQVESRATRSALLWGVAGFAILILAGELATETVTLSTYYPAPSGIYNQMITTGKTYLARDAGGFVSVGTVAALASGTVMAVMGGNVGIGTASPRALLSVGDDSQFQVSSDGDLAKIHNVAYSWPASQGAGVMTNDGSGKLSWAGGGGGASGKSVYMQPGVCGGQLTLNATCSTAACGKYCSDSTWSCQRLSCPGWVCNAYAALYYDCSGKCPRTNKSPSTCGTAYQGTLSP